MQLSRFLLLCAAASIAGAAPSFAAPQNVNGLAPVLLNGAGNADGVAFTAQGVNASTLLVGGAPQNINNNNNAVGVSSDQAGASTITFTTSSTVFGTVGTAAIPLLNINANGALGTALNFNGAVNSAQIHAGSQAVNFNSGGSNSAQLINTAANGTITIGTGTTVNGALTTTAGDNTGTLQLNSGSNLTGAVGALATSISTISVLGGSNTAGVSASITGGVNAYTFGLGTNTLTVTGALTIANQGAGGVINTTIASAGTYGNISVIGASNLATTLGLNVTVPTGALIPVGTIFNIVHETGAGTPGSVLAITDNNPLYHFVQVPLVGGTTTNGPVAIELIGTPLTVPLAPGAAVLPPAAPVAAAAAAALLAAAQTPDIIGIETIISGFTDPGAITNALAQLAPSAADLAAPLVTFQGTQQLENDWLSRMDDIMCGQVSERQLDEKTSSCKRSEPQSGWWVKGSGYFGSQGSIGSFPGYDSSILSTMIAYDAPIQSLRNEPLGIETRVGAGIGYARSAIDGRTFSDNTSINTYQAIAYIDHERGPWFVEGDVSFGWNDYSGTRNISFPGVSRTASAGYSGQDYTAFATTGFRIPVQAFTFTPLASLQYTHLDLDGYTETGAGDIDLKVNAQSYDFLESGLGAKVARPFAYGGGTFVPETHFKWLHEIVNPMLKSTASFVAGSPPFTPPGLQPGDDTLNVGAGLTFLSCACGAATWTLEAVYDYYWRADNYSANQGMLKLSARF